MSKTDLFVGCTLREKTFILPNDKRLQLHELKAKDRGTLRDLSTDDIANGQASIVIMGCDVLSEDDREVLLNLGGELLSSMADTVLDLSGLGEEGKEEAKKD